MKEKILDVDASMQGTLAFRDPVNLRINGKFEGKLDTKVILTIGEHAVIKADITGECITIAGRVNGNIKAQKSLSLVAPACVIGDIKTPSLTISEGSILEGYSNMLPKEKITNNVAEVLSVDEVAKYLEVDKGMVSEWANAGKLPAKREGSTWRFDRTEIEDWISNEKIK